MASPQVEDGYTRIANELLEALARINVGFSEAQVLYAVLRKTYGYHKTMDAISISQITEATGLSRRMVIYAIQNLESKNIITVERQKGRGHKNQVNKISIQKNYTKWIVQGKSEQYKKILEWQRLTYQKSKDLVVQGKVSSAKNADLVVQGNKKTRQFFAPTKENINTKEKTKDIYMRGVLKNDTGLFERFWSVYPPRNGKKLEKGETTKRFYALNEADQELCIKAAGHYTASELVRKGMGIRDPKRFIKDGKGNDYWRDWIEPEKNNADWQEED